MLWIVANNYEQLYIIIALRVILPYNIIELIQI